MPPPPAPRLLTADYARQQQPSKCSPRDDSGRRRGADVDADTDDSVFARNAAHAAGPGFCRERGAEKVAPELQAASCNVDFAADRADSSSILNARSSLQFFDSESDQDHYHQMRPEFETLLLGLKGRRKA